MGTVDKKAAETENTATIRNSPLAMPRACQAQQDIYRRALEEEDREER